MPTEDPDNASAARRVAEATRGCYAPDPEDLRVLLPMLDAVAAAQDGDAPLPDAPSQANRAFGIAYRERLVRENMARDPSMSRGVAELWADQKPPGSDVG